MPVHNIVKQLKKVNRDLKEAEIEGLLFLIKNESDLDNNELVRLTGLPKETLRSFKTSFGTYLSDSSSEKIKLNPEGLELLKDLNLTPYKWAIFSISDEELEQKLLTVRENYNLKPVREYDQWFATAKTSIAKAKMLEAKGLIDGKNIVLLGDDDLVSVVLILMGAKFNKLTVLDIDKAILNTIETVAANLGAENVFTQKFDAREELKIKDVGTYDVALTDPPYTRTGVALFLNRCIQLLKPHKSFAGSYIFLNYGNSFKAPEKTQKIQEVINDFGLVVEDKIDKFARYHGGESIGSASSLYILKTTPATSPKTDYLNNRIYTYENIKEEQFPYVDHFVFKISKVPDKIIKSKNSMQAIVREFCDEHKLKVVKIDITKFKPHGLTITVILANSNLLLHTWPEYKAVHIDLVTCSPIHKKESLVHSLARFFETKTIEVQKVE